ncbi:uncharacterized protein BCR38DRAFT_491508 [Pseudomassariella vexata]|uniref:Uncharacterized protein n=1 Tax=Pseudomassariella vexata TaxID=1141098 RepID=A0A1Y2EH29_9PEZI|nr:uncharacterized protein BCR38DRAFT_491508 [Pseudomassariella vexata]ORY70880.1 hypothetical protein BCR38DRAFT_491508 [Pseudomassariella vexata]
MKEYWKFADYTHQREPIPKSDSQDLELSVTSSLKFIIDSSDVSAFDQGKTCRIFGSISRYVSDSIPAVILSNETASDQGLSPATGYEKAMSADDHCFDQVTNIAAIPQNVETLNPVVLEEPRPQPRNSAVLTQYKSPDQDKTEAVEVSSNSSQLRRIRTECSDDNTSLEEQEDLPESKSLPDNSLSPHQLEKREGKDTQPVSSGLRMKLTFTNESAIHQRLYKLCKNLCAHKSWSTCLFVAREVCYITTCLVRKLRRGPLQFAKGRIVLNRVQQHGRHTLASKIPMPETRRIIDNKPKLALYHGSVTHPLVVYENEGALPPALLYAGPRLISASIILAIMLLLNAIGYGAVTALSPCSRENVSAWPHLQAIDRDPAGLR